MRIAVIGTGYVGLVTGTCFAETGNNVVCVDIDQEKIDKLNNGVIPIYEPGLEVIYQRNFKDGRLKFTSDLAEGLEGAEIVFLALPTPPGEDGSADLSYVLKAAEDVGRLIKDYTVLVDKSTVPVGTADKVHAVVDAVTNVPFAVVSNPEFLREGVAVDDFMKPDRVVIGTSDERSKGVMEKLYKPFVRQGNPIIFMDERSAEMTKYAANSFLATKISFMNEIANLCEKVGANVDMVRRGVGSDTRIGKRFIFPGIGYGGSCFPKDVQALHRTADEYNYDFQILNSVMEVNERQRHLFYQKIKSVFPDLAGKKVAMWGLAFKPNTDDIREAPAVYLIQQFLLDGAEVVTYDPEAMDNVRKIYGDKITYVDNQYDVLDQAEFLVISTEWSVFRTPKFDELSSRMKNKVIFDGRNLYGLEEMKDKGFDYYSIGRENVKSLEWAKEY